MSARNVVGGKAEITLRIGYTDVEVLVIARYGVWEWFANPSPFLEKTEVSGEEPTFAKALKEALRVAQGMAAR